MVVLIGAHKHNSISVQQQRDMVHALPPPMPASTAQTVPHGSCLPQARCLSSCPYRQLLAG